MKRIVVIALSFCSLNFSYLALGADASQNSAATAAEKQKKGGGEPRDGAVLPQAELGEPTRAMRASSKLPSFVLKAQKAMRAQPETTRMHACFYLQAGGFFYTHLGPEVVPLSKLFHVVPPSIASPGLFISGFILDIIKTPDIKVEPFEVGPTGTQAEAALNRILTTHGSRIRFTARHVEAFDDVAFLADVKRGISLEAPVIVTVTAGDIPALRRVDEVTFLIREKTVALLKGISMLHYLKVVHAEDKGGETFLTLLDIDGGVRAISLAALRKKMDLTTSIAAIKGLQAIMESKAPEDVKVQGAAALLNLQLASPEGVHAMNNFAYLSSSIISAEELAEEQAQAEAERLAKEKADDREEEFERALQEALDSLAD